MRSGLIVPFKSMKLAAVIIVFPFFLLSPTANSQVSTSPQQQMKVVSQGGYPALLNKAHGEGSVRLIATLDAPVSSMGHLQDYEAQIQVDTIAAMQAEIHTSLSGFGITNVTDFRYVPQIAMTVDSYALETLIAHPFVRSVAEDVAVPYTLNLSVPRIGTPEVWNQGFTGTGVVIAILDTGVDKTHPFLTGSVVSEACYSSNYAPHSASSVCPGGVTESTIVNSAMPYAGNCYPGECDHGTHVAGIAAGRDNGFFSGVAKSAGVIAVQVFSRFDSLSQCGGISPCVMAYTSDINRGLQRIYDLRTTYNIAAVNLSLGGGRYFSYCDFDPTKPFIDNLRSVNIATVIASGNEYYKNSISSPACISSAISVGATTDLDTVASYSNSATILSLLAPGSNINSSVPGGGYESWSGTSMATPHVAGSWALLRQAAPSQTVDQVLNALMTTGLGISDTNGITKPRIRVNNALAALKDGTGLYKMGIFSGGSWYFDMNGNGAWDGPSTDRYYADFLKGLTGDIPVVGDWDATGVIRIGVYWNGNWYFDMNGNGAWDGINIDRYYADFGKGLTEAIPVVGDWDETGVIRIGVYWNGNWYLDMNGNGAWNGTIVDRMHSSFIAGLSNAWPLVENW